MHTDKMLSAALFPPLSIFHTTTQSQTLVIHLCSKEGEGAAQPWDLSLPQTPAGARISPWSHQLLSLLLWSKMLKNVSRPGPVCWEAPEFPSYPPVELTALWIFTVQLCPSLAKADTHAVLVNKKRSFIAYCKSPDEKLAHSYLQHQSCLTPH